MPSTKNYYQERKKLKPPLMSATCWGGGHNDCKGMRGIGHREVCQCYCHTHICPRCNEPTTKATRSGLLNTATQLEALAKSVRMKALGLNA